jgi:hypothetical protein
VSDREPYDPTGLPYVVMWLSTMKYGDHDMIYGPFDNYDVAREFAELLGATPDHEGFQIGCIYPPEDYRDRYLRMGEPVPEPWRYLGREESR